MAFSILPSSFQDLVTWLRALERRLSIVEQRDPLANTGLAVPQVGEVDVNGLLRVLGNLIVSGAAIIDATGGIQSSNYVPGVSGWRLDGSNLIANSGSVSAGILPLMSQTARASTTNFALTTSYATLATATVTVPSGFTGLQVVASSKLYAVNPNTSGGSDGAGGDALYVRCNVNGSISAATPDNVPGSNNFRTTQASDSFTFSGLTPGSTFTVQTQGKSGYSSIAATANNYANIVCSLFWTR